MELNIYQKTNFVPKEKEKKSKQFFFPYVQERRERDPYKSKLYHLSLRIQLN